MRSMQTASSYEQVHRLALGDIVRLPDGRELTVRSCERRLSVPVGQMAGWFLVGEIGPQATLLSMPTEPGAPVSVFTPLEDIPAHARSARVVVEGVTSYWAPHLPNTSGAMGELAYRVCTVRASSEPMVLIWRGRELVVFVQSAVTSTDALTMWQLRQAPEETERDVTRYGAKVVPHRVPTGDPAPTKKTAPRRFTLPGRR